MTTMDIHFKYATPLNDEQVRQLAGVQDVYGIRKLRIDETEQRIAVEYDATRLTGARVSLLIEGCGVAVETLPVLTLAATE